MTKNKLSIVSWGIPCPVTASVHDRRLEREFVLTVEETNVDARILYLAGQFGSLFRCRCIPYIAIQELDLQSIWSSNSHITGILLNAPSCSVADAISDMAMVLD